MERRAIRLPKSFSSDMRMDILGEE